MPKNKALFLDRDGVICKAFNGYLTRWEEFELLPGIERLIEHAKKKGYLVVVVTNQPHIARGLLTEYELANIHARMQTALHHEIDAVYHCPHVSEDECDCRKPKPGMLMRAARDFDIDCTQSIMVGDRDRDVLAGSAVGCRTFFIKNEFNETCLASCSPDGVVINLEEIVASI